MPQEVIVPRFYGSETEYGYTLPKGVVSIAVQKAPTGIRRLGSFLENGARLYPDVGFFEYATPECPTLEDLVIHELAGEGLIWDAYGRGRTDAVTIHKRSLGPKGVNSTGSHESYSTNVDIWTGDESSKKNVQALASHFATRTIFTGAGRPTRRGLALGQKMKEITHDWGISTTKDKTLVNTRNEPHNPADSPLSRLHVICGDANISPWAIRMKHGTTSLVLRMLEHGVQLNDLFIKNPVAAGRMIAESANHINAPFLMQSGKWMSALDIQEKLATRAARLAKKVDLPEEELQVIEDWLSIIKTLRTYLKTSEHQYGMQQLDWYIKRGLLKRQEAEIGKRGMDLKPSERVAQRRALDLRYDRIPNGSGIKSRGPGKSFHKHTPSDEQIQKARTTPPEGRAKLRGAIIVKLNERGIKSETDINWSCGRVGGREYKIGPVEGDYSEEYVRKRVAQLPS